MTGRGPRVAEPPGRHDRVSGLADVAAWHPVPVTRTGIIARVLVIAAVVVVLGGGEVAHPSPGGLGLKTAVFDPEAFASADSSTAFAHVGAAGATAVRLLVFLDGISPGGAVKPPGFDPSDPADPAYNWSSVDIQVTKAVAAGLEPILCLYGMPTWGRDTSLHGYGRPSSAWFGKFAEGAARRYSGSFGSLPRVRYWQAWNEPNLGPNLEPQRAGSELVTPRLYRRLVNAFSSGVKTVHSDNSVIAGGLAPYEATTGDGIAPLTFMKEFLCMSGAQIRPRPRCLERAMFDIWSMQPYTFGGPTHQSSVDGDVQLGDLPEMKQVLDQAVASGRIVSSVDVQFWATEFSWDTNPPDTGALDLALHARWTAQALYTMWQNGISLVTWFLIRDRPPTERWQSGLYFAGSSIADDTPKEPTLEAFRFPMVAFVEGDKIRVWCRTPGGVPGNVRFEQSAGGGPFVPLAGGTVTSDANGIAGGVLDGLSSTGLVRAIFVPTGETSVPFSLTDVPDRPVDPWGN
jgi:hypothetical protein